LSARLQSFVIATYASFVIATYAVVLSQQGPYVPVKTVLALGSSCPTSPAMGTVEATRVVDICGHRTLSAAEVFDRDRRTHA
jgi:hypothetical protein